MDRCAVLVKGGRWTRKSHEKLGCKPTTAATGKVTSKARMALKKWGRSGPLGLAASEDLKNELSCMSRFAENCRCRCSVSAVHTVACLAPTTFHSFITNHHTSSISLWPQYWSDYDSHRCFFFEDPFAVERRIFSLPNGSRVKVIIVLDFQTREQEFKMKGLKVSS